MAGCPDGESGEEEGFEEPNVLMASLLQKISRRTKSKPTRRNARNYRPMIECRLGLATHGAVNLYLSIQTLALLLGLVGCWCSVRGGSQLQLLHTHTHPLSASLELKPDATQHMLLPRGQRNLFSLLRTKWALSCNGNVRRCVDLRKQKWPYPCDFT